MAILRNAYVTTDNQTFFSFREAWKHQCDILYPDIKLLDGMGNFTNDASKVESFIVNNEQEADFVNEFTDRVWDIWVCHCGRAQEGSVILMDDEEDATCYTHSDFECRDVVREMLDKYSYESDLRRYLKI